MATLEKPVDLRSESELRKLAEEGVFFQINTEHIDDSDLEEIDTPAIKNDELQYFNKECLGIFDEDTYEEGSPFELIGAKMCSVVPDGKIKKRIIREGDGEPPEKFSNVKIHYQGYLEFKDEPFDSTYTINKPRKFTIGNGQVIAGLDYAVQTMKLNEKSQFLIHPDYAFGKSSVLNRIPPNSYVLFEVELVEILCAGAAVTYDQLPLEEQQKFSEVYKYCMALSEKAKKLVIEHNLKSAIIEYNTAACRLERAILNDRDELEKQRELSLKLYTNLLICYTRKGDVRKGIKNAKKIYDLTENGELMKIPAKVYFNHAKCLRILGEYEEAKALLQKAYKMEPKNSEIANEMLNLERDQKEHKEKQLQFAKAVIGTKNLKLN